MSDTKRPAKAASGAVDVSAMSFEEALAELEQIVRGLEGGQQKLEDAIGAYERGAALRRHEVAYPCSDGHEARDTGLRELVVGRQEAGWRLPAGRLHGGAIKRLDHGP